MSNLVKTNLPCPKPACGSSDAYTIYDDGHGWCFSCNSGVFPKDKYNPDKFEAIFGSDRGVSAETFEKYNFKLRVDKDGDVHYHEYRYPEGVKFRRVKDKGFHIEGKVPALGGCELFDPANSPVITVVEGEVDAPSAYQMLNDSKRLKIERGVVWLTSGSIPHKARKEIFEKLNRYEKIVLAFEDDEKGKEAKDIIAEMLPTKVETVALLTYKDANDYLTNDAGETFKRAWNNRSRYVPDNIVNNNEHFFAIVDDEEKDVYIPTPFSQLNDKIKGLPLGHIILLTGKEGLGKTEILRALEWEVLQSDPDAQIGVLHFEEKQRTTLFGFCCYDLGANVRDPDSDYRELVKESIADWNKNQRLNLFDVEEENSIETVIETMRYLVTVCGCKYIFVDPINQFSPASVDDTKTKFLDSLAIAMERFVVKHNICLVWSAHVNDEGQTRDSRMIGKACSIRIDIDRDHMAADLELRNTTSFRVTKNRFCAETGVAGQVLFDQSTFTVEEKEFFDPEVAKTVSGEKIRAI